MFSLTAVLSYDQAFLQRLASANGNTMANIKAAMARSTIANICQPETSTRAFVNLGGQAQYIYRYQDGMPYMTIDIRRCF